MRIFRLSKKKYKDQLSGYGAALHGQRWNSKGIEVIYTAESRALAAYEVSVYLPLQLLPKDYYMIEINVPDSLSIKDIPIKDLPDGWDSLPMQKVSQIVGDTFVENNKHLILKVPSVIVKGDFNYIINPNHKDFKKIKIINSSLFPFDPRLKN
jgi:RES domain-containing protein